MTDDIVERLRNECQCTDDCRAVDDPCIPMRAADEVERLRALNDLLGHALEQMACQNCGDRRCMDCVCRVLHDDCVADCTECSPQERVHNPFVARHVQRAAALEAWRENRG